MFLKCIDTGLLSSNCYIIGDSGEAAVIDAGAGIPAISEVLDKEKLKLKYIILTHVHLDHIISMDKLRQKYDAKVLVHASDADALGDPIRNCSSLFGYGMTFDNADERIKHGDIIIVGELKLEIIHTPGHTPGGISIMTGGIIFTGDTLFRQGVGRTDLKGGNECLLRASIEKRLMNLKDDIVVYPGHGPSTTIGFERSSNPYIQKYYDRLPSGLIPELSVSDFNISVDFYTKILGFKIEYERKENQFAFLSFRKPQITVEQKNGNWETADLIYPFGRGINFQIEVDNVVELYANVIKHNYPIKIGIQENWYRAGNKLFGNKEFLVLDPDGYLLRFAQSIGERELITE